MESTEQIRIDKWLWAVRVYKTRQLATDACRGGKVNIARVKVKPSRVVKIGDVIIARTHALRRTVKALAVTDKRIGPKLAWGGVDMAVLASLVALAPDIHLESLEASSL